MVFSDPKSYIDILYQNDTIYMRKWETKIKIGTKWGMDNKKIIIIKTLSEIGFGPRPILQGNKPCRATRSERQTSHFRTLSSPHKSNGVRPTL